MASKKRKEKPHTCHKLAPRARRLKFWRMIVIIPMIKWANTIARVGHRNVREGINSHRLLELPLAGAPTHSSAVSELKHAGPDAPVAWLIQTRDPAALCSISVVEVAEFCVALSAFGTRRLESPVICLLCCHISEHLSRTAWWNLLHRHRRLSLPYAAGRRCICSYCHSFLSLLLLIPPASSSWASTSPSNYPFFCFCFVILFFFFHPTKWKKSWRNPKTSKRQSILFCFCYFYCYCYYYCYFYCYCYCYGFGIIFFLHPTKWKQWRNPKSNRRQLSREAGWPMKYWLPSSSTLLPFFFFTVCFFYSIGRNGRSSGGTLKTHKRWHAEEAEEAGQSQRHNSLCSFHILKLGQQHLYFHSSYL